MVVEAGYRIGIGPKRLPAHSEGALRHQVFVGSHTLLGGLYLGGGLTTVVNRRAGTFPAAWDAQIGVGATDHSQGTQFAAFYVGWRHVHSVLLGDGTEWDTLGSGGGPTIGFVVRRKVGPINVLSETELVYYAIGWKWADHAKVGFGSRSGVGYGPVMLDVVNRYDPGTGREITVGLGLNMAF